MKKLLSIGALASPPATVLLIGIIAARLFGQEAFAEYSLALALISPVLLLFGAGVRVSQLSNEDGAESSAGYLEFRIISSLAGGILAWFFAEYFYHEEKLIFMIAAAAFYKLTEGIFDYHYAVCTKRSLYVETFLMMQLRTVIIISSLIGFWSIGADFPLSVIASSFLSTLIISRLLPKLSDFAKFKLLGLRRIFEDAFSFSLSVSLLSLNASLPRLFVGKLATQEQLAVISAGFYVITAVSVIFTGIGNLWLASHGSGVSRQIKSGSARVYFLQTFKRYLWLAVIISVITYTLSEPLVSMLFGSDFSSDKKLMFILSLGAGMTAIQTFVGNFLAAGKMRKAIVLASGVCVLGNIAAFSCLNALAIFGQVEDAALSWLIGSLIFVLVGFFKIQRESV